MAQGNARVLRELRRARRRRHFSSVDLWDALYQVYVTAIFGSVGVAVVSGYAGGHLVAAATVHRAAQHGPAAVGIVIAAIVGLGLRSGARGGPIAIEAADVHVVLLAPVSRQRALLGPALRQLRYAVFVGATAGAVVGNLASRRLPGGWAPWVASGAGTGAAAAVAAVGAALLVSGLRGGRWGSVAALALLAWSTADLLTSTATSPATLLGELALRPIGVRGAPWVGVAATAAVVALGLSLLGRTAIAAAQRRAALVAQLRFAITMQDLRTVVLVRRVLAQEAPRSRPWLRVGRLPRQPVWRRDAHGLLRWSAARFGRLVLLGAVAGGLLAAVWNGTTALLAVAGAALFFAALDTAEGLAQEGDRPVRRDSLPVNRRWLTVQHMVVPLVAMIGVGVVGVLAVTAAAVAGGTGHASLALAVGGPAILPAAMGAVCGGVLSVVSEPFDPLSPELLFEPEIIGGIRFLIRVGATPGLAVTGALPVLAAQSRSGTRAASAAAEASAAVLAVLAAFLVVYWRGRADPA